MHPISSSGASGGLLANVFEEDSIIEDDDESEMSGSIIGGGRMGSMMENKLTSASRTSPSLTKQQQQQRSPVTSLAAFGSTIVASGALDGSVFLAHTITFGENETHDDEDTEPIVRGVRLEWGSQSPHGRSLHELLTKGEGENSGVGAVTCLAAARGIAASGKVNRSKLQINNKTKNDQAELLAKMEGCRVVAGTTNGDLRVWSVKDVYASAVLSSYGEAGQGIDPGASSDHMASAIGDLRTRSPHASGATSSFTHRKSIHDFALSTATSKFRSALRGKALPGHRGEVTCIDVPNSAYRPDEIISCGEDGLIKLWSLRQANSGQKSAVPGRPALFKMNASADLSVGPETNLDSGPARRRGSVMIRPGGSTDPVVVMNGHGGKVLCAKTSFHADRLLSGGADRTVRIWDLVRNNGKCLHTMSGHVGWVTHVRYWGTNIVISGSTDRSVGIWDARVKATPLFQLRYHMAAISDLLVGEESDPYIVSAGADGMVASWDMRSIMNVTERRNSIGRQTIREPLATMNHNSTNGTMNICGSVLLNRGFDPNLKSVLSVGADGMLKQWEIETGTFVDSRHLGHGGMVSKVTSFNESENIRKENDLSRYLGGIVTGSWDGSVMVRRLKKS